MHWVAPSHQIWAQLLLIYFLCIFIVMADSKTWEEEMVPHKQLWKDVPEFRQTALLIDSSWWGEKT